MSEPFSWGQYAGYLDLAGECGYRFAGFDEVETSRGRVIYLRHDIDFALRWVPPMAELEHEHGVRSTYCFLLDSQNYASETAEFDATVARTLELGHWLGLHFDATGIADDDVVVERVVSAAAALERRFGTELTAVSFHMPTRRPVTQIELPAPLVNTYGPRFFTEIGYASDSNQHWRGTDFEQMLRSGEHERIQLLIHPMWWRADYMPMLAKLEELAAEIGMPIGDLLTDEQQALIDAGA